MKLLPEKEAQIIWEFINEHWQEFCAHVEAYGMTATDAEKITDKLE